MNPRTHAAAALEPTEQEIAHQAYLRWLENGRPAGTELTDWLAAKALLEHHHARDLEPVRQHRPLRPLRSRPIR
ncbi:MAG TPA: DUF2934 domain-containing protein [Opitutaceae bacterium]|jgi:hypothetical protein|nr:DUF2934 domain-containing protein [Opitutaceae bacterium]